MSHTPYPLWTIFVMVFVLQGCGGGGSSKRVLENPSAEINQSSLSTSLPANEVSNESRFNFNHANPLPQELLQSVNVGFGGRNAFPFAQQERKEPIWLNTTTLLLDTNLTQNPTINRIHNVDVNKFSELQQYLIKSKYIAYWITKGWKESWFTPHKIQEAMDAGYVPIFIYYYFGDALDAVPSGALLEAYYQDTHRVSRFMQGLKGTKLLIMEPEFNKEEIVKNDASMRAFAKVMVQGIENIEHNVSDIYFSLCMTDKGRREANLSSASCGYEHCALGDQYTWSKTDLIYEILADKLSFLSFQQMVAQFSRNPENPGTWDNPNPKAFSEF